VGQDRQSAFQQCSFVDLIFSRIAMALRQSPIWDGRIKLPLGLIGALLRQPYTYRNDPPEIR
jgi:hypothetical protein